MIEQLVDDFVRHRRDICPHPCGLNDMKRVAQAGSQDLGLPLIVAVDLDYFAQQQQPVMSNVIKAAQKRTDE